MNHDYNSFTDGLSNGVYGSRAERLILEMKKDSNLRCLQSNNLEESQLKLFGNQDGLPRESQIRIKSQLDVKNKDIIINNEDKIKVINEKDPKNIDLDLNLSLQIKTQEDDDTRHNEVNEGGLSLSLFSSTSTKSPSDVRRSKHTKIMSSNGSTTLDLTL